MNKLIKLGAAIVSLAILAPIPVNAAVTSKDPAQVTAGHYVVDPTHVSVVARVDHLGFSTTAVTFDKVSGGFDYDPAKPAQAAMSIAIAPAALDSGNDERDGHLKGPGFFNVTAYPEITFKSTGFVAVDATHAKVEGQLTLLGVTKPVTLDVTFNGFGTGMAGDTRTGFIATTQILRSDFGMKTFLPAIGDKVDLLIDAEFIKQK